MKMDVMFAVLYGLLLGYLTFFMDKDLVIVTVLLLLGIVLVLSFKAMRHIAKEG